MTSKDRLTARLTLTFLTLTFLTLTIYQTSTRFNSSPYTFNKSLIDSWIYRLILREFIFTVISSSNSSLPAASQTSIPAMFLTALWPVLLIILLDDPLLDTFMGLQLHNFKKRLKNDQNDSKWSKNRQKSPKIAENRQKTPKIGI